MAQPITVWYDGEADFLEVLFSDEPGFMRQTNHEAVMERVDKRGKVLGFSVMQVSRYRKQQPLVAELT